MPEKGSCRDRHCWCGCSKAIGVLEFVRVLVLHKVKERLVHGRKCTHLPHIYSDLTALANDARGSVNGHPLLQVWQYLRRSDPPESLGSLVAHHLRLSVVFQDLDQRRDRVRGKHLAKDEGYLVSVRWRRVSSCLGEIMKATNLNKALSSENPEARASTASGVPMFLKPNIARYRSKRGRLGSRSFACRLLTVASVI